jgi:hypothetical protein
VGVARRVRDRVARADEVELYLEVDGQTGEILFSAGPHPVRELLDGSFNINLALPAFCDILR